jgi:hypothetical protein
VKILDMKKILVLALFLVVVVSTVAAISASEDLTLEGIKFNIPDGYSLIEQETDATEGADTEHMDGTAVDKEVTSEYKNSAGDKLNVHVGIKNNQKIDSINPGGEKKTISGKDGFIIKEKDDGKDKYKFEYLQDGKIVKISAVSEDIISQVIA